MANTIRSLAKNKLPLICAAFIAVSQFTANANPESPMISQKKRTYDPGAITIPQGSSIKIINDDIFLHHTFINDDRMEFDSGSQKKGTVIEIAFKERGVYDVLCAIHPKMKLEVTVE